VPAHSLPLLAKLLEDRTNRLQGQLQRMHSQAMNISDTSILDCLFEDLHWLVLIAGVCSAYIFACRGYGHQWGAQTRHLPPLTFWEKELKLRKVGNTPDIITKN
jgi:hypothetical protein